MVDVRDVRLEDEDEILSFLERNFGRDRMHYKGIFSFARSDVGLNGIDEPRPLGCVLVNDDGEIVGYLGVLAHRLSGGPDRWVMNMTGWVVEESVRAHSLRLLRHLLSRPHQILTNFSGTEITQKILQKFGFERIDREELIFSTLGIRLLIHGLYLPVIRDDAAIELIDNPNQRRILQEHLGIGCRVLAFPRSSETLGFALLRRPYGRFSAAVLIHCTEPNPGSIGAVWEDLKAAVFWKMNCQALMIDGRFAPPDAVAHKRKPRDMLVFGLENNPSCLTRAYSEPLQRYGDFGGDFD